MENTKRKAARLGKVGRLAKLGNIAKRATALLPAASTIAGGGAVAVLAPDAQAAIIQSSVANLAIPVTTAGVYFNVITGVTGVTPAAAPGWDLNLWGSSSLRFWANNGSETQNGMMAFPGGTATSVGNLAPGTLVSSAATFNRTPDNESAPAGQFQVNGVNYVGFRFLDSSNGTVHFGWASILVGPTLTNSARRVLNVYYESTANTGIVVGDTGTNSIPEPSTAFLLASGAAGLIALRRRRKLK